MTETEYLTIVQANLFLRSNVPARTFQDWCKDGWLKSIKSERGHYLIEKSEIENLKAIIARDYPHLYKDDETSDE